ncbi:MAG: ATP-binding protein [Fibrobacterota bacterium]
MSGFKFRRTPGQKSVEKTLDNVLSSGKIHHAFLFTGPEGCGKLSAALEFAAALLCREKQGEIPCGVCHSCKKSEKGSHPDLSVFFPFITKGNTASSDRDRVSKFIESTGIEPPIGEKSYEGLEATVRDMLLKNPYSDIFRSSGLSIHTAEVKEAIDKIISKPFESDSSVTIITECERMNNIAANKFLKTLEEPPPSSRIILVTSKPDLLLPTIRSRTSIVRFRPLLPGEVKDILISRFGVLEEDASKASEDSLGNVKRAASLVGMDSEEIRADASELLESILSGRSKALSCYESLIKNDKSHIQNVLEHVLIILYDIFIFHNVKKEENNFISNKIKHFLEELDNTDLEVFKNSTEKALYALKKNAAPSPLLYSYFLFLTSEEKA